MKAKDYPDFQPNLTPFQIFDLGAFGGTYYRNIYSSVTNKSYKNKHKEFKQLDKIPDNKIISSIYDTKINKYKVKCGSSLEDWEQHHWISKYDPYGWIQFYCRFFEGRRCPDDQRQIDRWMHLTGPNGRFRLRLIKQIYESGKKYNDFSISPKIRQTLLHWAYQLTYNDYKKGVQLLKSRQSIK